MDQAVKVRGYEMSRSNIKIVPESKYFFGLFTKPEHYAYENLWGGYDKIEERNLPDDIVLKGRIFYKLPRVIIRFSDGSYKEVLFNTDKEMHDYLHEVEKLVPNPLRIT